MYIKTLVASTTHIRRSFGLDVLRCQEELSTFLGLSDAVERRVLITNCNDRQGLSDRAVVDAGDDRTFGGDAIIPLDAKPTGVIFKLQAQQAVGAFSTIEAQPTVFTTFIQVEEL